MTDAAKSCVRGKPIFCSTCKVTAISFSSAGEELYIYLLWSMHRRSGSIGLSLEFQICVLQQ